MQDKYKRFEKLAGSEKGNFAIHSQAYAGTPVVVAPHGGKIEPGTLEIAKAIAGQDLSFYAFEGRKTKGNKDLHITSHKFDEPQCVALVSASPSVVTIHGLNGAEQTAYVGGLDQKLGNRVSASLAAEGFAVKTHWKASLKGLHSNNICNRGQSGRGVQLELTKGLRDSLTGSAERFDKFVGAVRGCLV
jgi:phage replication-related protein YjqB (UPF0714/DUF867 family)